MKNGVFVLSTLVVMCSMSLAGQQEAQTTDVANTIVRFKAQGPIPNLPYLPAISLPVQCNSDGTLFFDSIKPENPSEHTVYEVTVKNSLRFNTGMIPGLYDVHFLSSYPSDSQLGMLVRATTESAQDKMTGAPHSYYVVTFDLKGNFKKSTAIEVSPNFMPSHLALLRSGELLVSGFDKGNQVARLVLLDVDGTFKRPIDLPAARLPNSPREQANPMYEIHRSERLLGSVSFSNASDSVLVWRGGSTDPIVEVREGGALREVPIQIPSGFVLADLVASNDRWVAHFRRATYTMKQAQNTNDPHIYAYYEVRPSDGTLARQLTLQGNRAGTVYCEHDSTYLSFEVGGDNKMLLLTSE